MCIHHSGREQQSAHVQESKEYSMDLGTKVMLISGAFLCFSIIIGLFGKKMSD